MHGCRLLLFLARDKDEALALRVQCLINVACKGTRQGLSGTSLLSLSRRDRFARRRAATFRCAPCIDVICRCISPPLCRSAVRWKNQAAVTTLLFPTPSEITTHVAAEVEVRSQSDEKRSVRRPGGGTRKKVKPSNPSCRQPAWQTPAPNLSFPSCLSQKLKKKNKAHSVADGQPMGRGMACMGGLRSAWANACSF